MTKPTEELIKDFLVVEKSKCTDLGYRALAKNMKWIEGFLFEKEWSVRDVGMREGLEFQNWLSVLKGKSGKPVQAGTMNNRIQAARRFFDYLLSQDVIKTNPFRELRQAKVGQRVSDNVLTQEQMGRLLNALGRFDEEKHWSTRKAFYRVHVAAELMYSVGLRAIEAASLEPEDIDLDSRGVRVRSGRAGYERIGFLTDYAAFVVKKYLEKRKQIFGAHQRVREHTFFGVCSIRLIQVMNQVLAKVCVREKIPVITSDGLRASLGVHLLETDCDLRHVQLIVGYRSLGSTQVFLKNSKNRLRAVMESAHPRAKWEEKSE